MGMCGAPFVLLESPQAILSSTLFVFYILAFSREDVPLVRKSQIQNFFFYVTHRLSYRVEYAIRFPNATHLADARSKVLSRKRQILLYPLIGHCFTSAKMDWGFWMWSCYLGMILITNCRLQKHLYSFVFKFS